MKRSWMASFTAFALILSGTVAAESYLCVADGAAGVRDRGPENIVPNVFNHESIKFIQTKVSGEWVVKVLGKDYALFDDCISEWHCERKDGFAGVFSRRKDGVFTSMTLGGSQTDNFQDAVVAKGRCTKLE